MPSNITWSLKEDFSQKHAIIDRILNGDQHGCKTRYKAKKIKIVFLILTIPYEMLRQAMFQLRSPEYSLNYENGIYTAIADGRGIFEFPEEIKGSPNRTSCTLRTEHPT